MRYVLTLALVVVNTLVFIPLRTDGAARIPEIDDCLEACKDKCTEIWERCYDACGRDHVCKERCMRELTECLKECERRCK